MVNADGKEIEGSPFTIEVSGTSVSGKGAVSGSAEPTEKPADTPEPRIDKFKSDVVGNGLLKSHAGAVRKLNVNVRDKSGRGIEDANVEVIVESSSGDKLPVQINNKGKGTYQVLYTPEVPSSYKLFITADGIPIGRNPYTVPIGTKTSPRKTSIARWTFSITARNENGEQQEDGDDQFEVSIDGPTGPVAADVQDLGKGEYSVTFKPPTSGTYKVHAKLGGEDISGSPFTIAVL